MRLHVEVLIDTWWNVNVNSSIQAVLNQPVLIDTWWNVNDTIYWYDGTHAEF